ncbi:hypothetical protein CTI12_AA514860 [Artemisia annua]|uniref:Reverse transcriptase domain-containing protein n=1 Tax=Artemisia annua TaxID=35608 RepID=A0A2U1L9M1_ARTAN|nr:hypothetical protein CTI12_AA514860 [Artemisia annua]
MKEGEDPGCFILPIRLEGKLTYNALVDTRSNINIMPYCIFALLEKGKASPKIDKVKLLDHSNAETIGRLLNQEVDGVSPPLLVREFSARWWNAVSEDQADMKAVMSHYNSLVRSPSPGPSCSNTDDDTIKRIQECKSKEEIQRILDEVRKSPTPSEELYQDSQDPYEDDGFLS